MNPLLQRAIRDGRLILLLGAGASSTSAKDGKPLPSSDELSRIIADAAGWVYMNEPLSTVYAAAQNILGIRLIELLEARFKHCQPSREYLTIAKYPWARIYTLNIDDAFEKALSRNSPQRINIRHRNDRIVDADQLFHNLDYIKLNGSIDRTDAGFIFSPKEYGSASGHAPPWYQELAQDYFRYSFLFVGTKLNEPLFFHQIERYRLDMNSVEAKGYVLTPTATEIEKASLESLNLIHIPGNLENFAEWLSNWFPVPLQPNDLAMNANPALREMLLITNQQDRYKYAELFKHITFVNKVREATDSPVSKHETIIRNFYKGFKPEWKDIIDQVPAEIGATTHFYNEVLAALADGSNIVVVYGPAGSGKTTLLKQTALNLADRESISTYYIEEPVQNLPEILAQLERLHNNRYCVFCDRLDDIASDLREFLESGRLQKGLFIGSERQNKWESMVQEHVGKFCKRPFHLSEIDKADATIILDKVEKFGPWTRLSKLRPHERIDDLVTKAKRQLLIGLLEATSGVGFEQIIENEYSELRDNSERYFLILVGLATINRIYLRENQVLRTLSNLNINLSINKLSSRMSGIIHYEKGKLLARHSVYVRHLFNSVVGSEDLYNVLNALLESYTVYEAPVLKKVGRNEAVLYKVLINHKFLKELFRTRKSLVLEIYKSFEKSFENDGLFWLQYGLALRDFGLQDDAFEKLNTAYIAYPQPHTEHALAQQELIIACRSANAIKAYDLLEKAKVRLEALDKSLKSFDTYPIVTLSEGHTNVVRIIEGDNKGRLIAKHYANIISERMKGYEYGRLKKAWVKLSTYATGGDWRTEEEEDLFC